MPLKKDLIVGIVVVVLILVVAGAVYFALQQKGQVGVTSQVAAVKNADFASKNWTDCLTQAAALTSANKNNAEAWDLKGVCEFQLGKFTDAKASFDAALNASSGDVVAKNYENLFSSTAQGIVLLTGSTGDITRANFESASGLMLDTASFAFTRAYVIPVPAGSKFTNMTSASYTSSRTYANAVDYFKTKLPDASLMATSNATYFDATTDGLSQTVTVFKNMTGNGPVSISVTYAKK
jgi:tetratricopeptide (TPR) repeat protein